MKLVLNLLFLVTVCCSCGSPNAKQESAIETVQKEPEYYAVRENIDLLISPSFSSKKLINEKASSITKDTEYCGLDKSCKLIVIESKGKYSKVKVIEPDWLTDTYVGWVPTNMLVKFGAIASAKATLSNVAAFNDVKKLITELSKNEIGELHSWRSDDAGGFMSITDYYRFGTASPVSGLENNLGYYLESRNEAYVEKLVLVLNIFNADERMAALEKFKIVTEKTFKSLKVPAPSGLIKAVSVPKIYSYQNELLSVSLGKEDNDIESWKLAIKSK